MSDACTLQSCVVGGEVKRGQTTLVPSLRRALQWDCGESDDIEGVWLINENYNEIHGYIYEYILTY